MFAHGFPQQIPPEDDPERPPNSWLHPTIVYSRYALLSLFVHALETVATPIAIVCSIKPPHSRETDRVGLIWAIMMLTRLPFMIPSEMMILYRAHAPGAQNAWLIRLCGHAYTFWLMVQTGLCAAGAAWSIYRLCTHRSAAHDGQLNVWVLSVSVLNLFLVFSAALNIAFQIAFRGLWVVPVAEPGPPPSMSGTAPDRLVRVYENRGDSSPPAPNSSFDRCCICTEPFHHSLEGVARAVVVRTACNHLFHESCLRRWNETRTTCPMCNAPVSWPLLV